MRVWATNPTEEAVSVAVVALCLHVVDGVAPEAAFSINRELNTVGPKGSLCILASFGRCDCLYNRVRPHGTCTLDPSDLTLLDSGREAFPFIAELRDPGRIGRTERGCGLEEAEPP